ncbi:hypothetical protein [Spirochaeta isovalerica]|uniref:Methyl-accepting transducer domain-containing protein n=1 Tax=Spirochaeta isovalerica TaxID=150 RepID=A0A841R779_9SPIO|nr:hypothetical protein [Spirochaeta isovalerica]MBB6481104.1 hypothetical protein [Spirochaeta isovalerica]
MKDDIQQIKEKLIKRLNELVEKTEEIYLNLGRDYPQLLQELNRSISESSESVNSAGRFSSAGSIDAIIDEASQITIQFKDSLFAIYKRDGELFEIIERGISEMGVLSGVIANIKEISIEMELISLNAMTVALKSGTAGKAFSFITDELKKLSAQTIRLTDQLTDNGTTQLNSFELYRKKISEAGEKQKSLNSRLDSHLEQAFTTSSMALKDSSEIMQSLSRSSKDIQPPLMRIMEEVQLQDIIRQSIDHIYISLDQFKAIESSWSEEEKLDELAFRKILPDLCFSVLEDVKKELKGSQTVFEEQSALVKSLLDSLEERRASFVNSSLDASGREGRSITALREESAGRIEEMIHDVNQSIKMSQDISEEGIKLIRDLLILQRQFLSFEPIITRFHNIIVASKIEVAKQAALGDMKGTVSNMTDLTEGIDNDISRALDTIKHFLKTTEKTIGEYSLVIRKEMPELKNLTSRTADNQAQLSEITDTLIENLRSFRLFTPRFFTLYGETERNRKKLKELEEGISHMETLLNTIRNNANEGYALLGGNTDIENWTIQNERLANIINKFTIFTHKKTASDLAGTAVEAEEAAESGEVTFF